MDSELEEESALHDPSVMQSITRCIDEQGCEQWVGYFRVNFDENETSHVLHCPFWPSFLQVPKISATVIEGEDATCRITVREVFGARIEVNLRQRAATGKFSSIVEVVATSSILTTCSKQATHKQQV